MKKYTLFYVSAYLLVGGLGLAVAPAEILDLFQSNGDYGDTMPRVAGILMVGLSGLIALLAYNEDYKYYPYSLFVRTLFVLFFFFLYFRSDDPFFLVLNVIILIGLVPSLVIYGRERIAQTIP